MKALIGLCGVLVFMTMTSVAEQRGGSGVVVVGGLRLLGIQARAGQVSVTTRKIERRGAAHTAVLPATPQGAAIAPAKSFSFRPIAPIAPMGPLFPDDHLQRTPWASFGFHRASARRPLRVALVTSRATMEARKVIPAAILAPRPDAQEPIPLERASSDRPSSDRVTAWAYPRDALRPHESFAGHGGSSGISPERAKQIQSALIQHGYLDGAATGTWDAASLAAMRRLQADHGWQTKLAPDARALTFLGLGPGGTAP